MLTVENTVENFKGSENFDNVVKPTTQNPFLEKKKLIKSEAELNEARKINEQLDKFVENILHYKNHIIGEAELKIGENLKKAEDIIKKHKMSWSAFLAKCGIHAKKASRMILLYEQNWTTSSIAEVGGVNKALALSTLPKSEREAFIKKKHSITDSRGNVHEKGIQELSVRDVNELVGNLKNPKKATSNEQVKVLSIPAKIHTSLFKRMTQSAIIDELSLAIPFYRKYKDTV